MLRKSSLFLLLLILTGCTFPSLIDPDPVIPDLLPVVENLPPYALFSVSNPRPLGESVNPYIKGEPVTCDGSYSRDDGYIVRWIWTFAGYGQQEGIIVVQTFSNTKCGWNPIRLTVIDNDGAVTSTDYGVTVYDSQCTPCK